MQAVREIAQRWLTPLAKRVPLSPDGMTLLGFFCNLAAAASLALAGRDPGLFLLALALLVAGGVFDILDGLAARLRGITSEWGDFFDHLLDRASDTALVAGWVVGTSHRLSLALGAVIAILLNGYTGTQVEASFRVREYRTTGRAEFFIALIGFPLIAWGYTAAGNDLQRPLGGLSLPEWLTSVLIAFAAWGLAQRVALARRLSRGSRKDESKMQNSK